MDEIISEIKKAAARHYQIDRIILFGSRSRGDNSPRSDIDLAVYTSGDMFDFVDDIECSVPTLLEFDITDMRMELEPDFAEQIENEGIVIYDKENRRIKTERIIL